MALPYLCRKPSPSNKYSFQECNQIGLPTLGVTCTNRLSPADTVWSSLATREPSTGLVSLARLVHHPAVGRGLDTLAWPLAVGRGLDTPAWPPAVGRGLDTLAWPLAVGRGLDTLAITSPCSPSVRPAGSRSTACWRARMEPGSAKSA